MLRMADARPQIQPIERAPVREQHRRRPLIRREIQQAAAGRAVVPAERKLTLLEIGKRQAGRTGWVGRMGRVSRTSWVSQGGRIGQS